MQHTDDHNADNRSIMRVTYIGMVANIALTALKVVTGLLVGSLSLVADGIHSLSDLSTDVVVLLGVHFGSKKADPHHPYGHGRIETFSALIIALALIGIGLGIIYRSSITIIKAREAFDPGFFAIFIACVSIASKEVLYRITRKVAVTSHSPALYANAWHHRTDALSSIAVLVGLIAAIFGFEFGDSVAAIAVGIMIGLVGIRIILDCIHELSESAVDETTINQIVDIIHANSQIRNYHKLRSRTVGREIFLDLHILVERQLNIEQAHKISEDLEKTIVEQIVRPVNITVHIEPYLPGLRQ